MKQLDLFVWAESRPSNVIDARWKFEAKVMALVEGMLNGRVPPHVDGQIITGRIRRDRQPGEAA